MLYGLLNLSFWGYVIATIVLSQITIACVTIYLHRCQTHRALTLHPIASHFFRFWLWITTGMITAQWVAIHRKHHAFSDKPGDPHSPVVLGLKKVLWEGAELYSACKSDEELIAKYSHGTPTDWIERNIYSRFPSKGITLMFFINLLLFGIPGITVWAIQMIWIPFHAAGVINGIGHFWGYRNFECKDAATNIIPWAFWIGGEELHNNHHTFASSAKFSVKWWEFDIGWLYIRCLSMLGLAKVKKLPPKLTIKKDKKQVDFETVKAVIGNRFQIMSYYYKWVARPILKLEKQSPSANKDEKKLLQQAGRLLRLQENLLSPIAKTRLQTLLATREKLRLVYNYKQSLQNIWLKTAATQKDLVDALQQWCKQAEDSGLDVLSQFAKQIKCFEPKTISV
jgi:stearoyl-CoA desaturase (delta-9 desaturase)